MSAVSETTGTAWSCFVVVLTFEKVLFPLRPWELNLMSLQMVKTFAFSQRKTFELCPLQASVPNDDLGKTTSSAVMGLCLG